MKPDETVKSLSNGRVVQ